MNVTAKPIARVLVVDDEPAHRESLRRIFERDGYEVVLAEDGAAAVEILRQQHVDVVLSDLVMPRIDGQELVKAAKAERPDLGVIVMTAYGTVENAVAAMREGAYDFLTKPVKRGEVLAAVGRVVERQRLVDENRLLRAELEEARRGTPLVGNSAVMQRLIATLHQVAPSNATVLITGEAGTGKEVCARTIHSLSPRKQARFVAVNCAAIPADLIEVELFGSRNDGVSTTGRVRLAEGGTLFLDEISALPQSVQVRMLHMLQGHEHDAESANDDDVRSHDVRVLTAHDGDLKIHVDNGTFREDLYYRLSVIPIALPPLRDREGDLPLLAMHFVRKFNERHKKQIDGFHVDAMNAMVGYRFPGNVRELENAIERAVVLSTSSQIVIDDLPPAIRDARAPLVNAAESIVFRVGQTMEQIERAAILATMRHTGNDKTLTAKLLGISLRTLYRRLEEPNVDALSTDTVFDDEENDGSVADR